MKKQYYFLSGIPRSGNTLLSSILNQNKKIASTPNSLISEILYNFDSFRYSDVAYNNFPDHKSYESMMTQLIPSYYKNWDQKYIIDRGPWGTPDNLNLLKKYCPNKIKIIVLLRDINEVLASFIKWSQENPNNFIDREFTKVEDQCDFLMSPKGQIVKNILSSFNLFKPENINYSIFINYNDLVKNTEETVKKIYDFLDIEPYKHDFNRIKNFNLNGIDYNDTLLGENLHKVKKTIETPNYSIFDYLPKSTIEKYKEFTFWGKIPNLIDNINN